MSTLATALAAELPGRAASIPTAAALTRKVEDARARWPDLSLSDAALARHLARHLGDTSFDDAVASLCAEDFLLAAACLEGDTRAIAALDRTLLTPVVSDVARSYRDADATELEQVVRERVLVGRTPGGGKLASYAGRAPLAAWLRVVAVREAVTMLRRVKPTEPTSRDDSDDALVGLLTDDVEIEHLRAEYAPEFKLAFQAAVATLTNDERTILRLHVLDGVAIDGIGQLYGVHRATAARWLIRIREALFDATRDALAERLRIGDSEFASLVGVLLSRLDVSLQRVLSDLEADERAPAPPLDTRGARG